MTIINGSTSNQYCSSTLLEDLSFISRILKFFGLLPIFSVQHTTSTSVAKSTSSTKTGNLISSITRTPEQYPTTPGISSIFEPILDKQQPIDSVFFFDYLKKSVQPSKKFIWRFYSKFIVLSIIIYTFIPIYIITLNKDSTILTTAKSRHTDHITTYIEFVLCVSSYLTTITVSVCKSGKHLQILNQLLDIDDDIYKFFKMRIQYRNTYVYKILLYATIFVFVLLTSLRVSIMKDFSGPEYLSFTSYLLQMMICSIFTFYICVLLDMISSRLKFINESLKKQFIDQKFITKTSKTKSVVVFNKSKNHNQSIIFDQININDIMFMFSLYIRLLNVEEIINDVSGVILLCIMGYSFYTVTAVLYALFMEITTSNGIPNSFLYDGLFWVVLHAMILMIICIVCDKIQNEIKRTAEILSRVFGKNKECLNLIDKFLTKSIKQEAKFTAYGFFSIDKSTLFKIASAVTTYLVILIQFKQLEESSD